VCLEKRAHDVTKFLTVCSAQDARKKDTSLTLKPVDRYMASMQRYVLFLLGIMCFYVQAQPTSTLYNNYATFTLNNVPQMKLMVDYTRVAVPTTNQITLVNGRYHVGDWIAVTFTRNEEQGFMYSTNEPYHFMPLVCLYETTLRTDPVVFRGCYNNLTTVLPRMDAPDVVFNPGSEVFFVSRITVQLIHLANPATPSAPKEVEQFYQPVSEAADDSFVSDYCSYHKMDVYESDNSASWWNSIWTRWVSFLERFNRVTVKIDIPIREQSYFNKLQNTYNLAKYTVESMPSFVPTHVVRAFTYLKAFTSNSHAAYDAFKPYFSLDAQFDVVGLTNYTGRENIYSYQLLADFSVSDSIRVDAMNKLHVTTQGHVVMFQVMMESSFPHNIGTSVPSQWNNRYMVIIEFDRYGLMKYFVQHVNLLDAVLRRTPSTVANITIICDHIQSHCTPDVIVDNLPGSVNAVQFNSTNDCVAYMNSLTPTSPFGFVTSGRTLACVDWHQKLAVIQPEHHCMHSGPQVISPLVTPCQNF
jgi:hypothetical protein